MNHTDEFITFWEKGNVNGRVLKPHEMIYYTWNDPAGERKITWKNMNRPNAENDLRRDGVDQFFVAHEESHEPGTSTSEGRKGHRKNSQTETLYWVSFLDGTQRVLLFTKNQSLAQNSTSSNRMDKVGSVLFSYF